MLFFFNILAVVAFFSYVEIFGRISRKAQKMIYVIIFFVIYLLSFLRWEYGTDWDTYYKMFLSYDLSNELNQELLFVYILVLARTIIEDYTFALFILATILFFFNSKSMWRLSPLPLTTLLVFVGTYICSQIGFTRQQIAMSLTFYSIIYIEKREFWKYLWCIVVAFGFHYSALVFLPAWWIFDAQISTKKWLFVIIISIFLSSMMSTFLVSFGQLVGGGMLERASGYTEEGYAYEDNASISPQQLIIRAILNRGLIFGLCVYLLSKVTGTCSNVKNFFNLYCFGTILFFLSSPIHITLARMTWYYDFVQVILLPQFFLYCQNRYLKNLCFFMLVGILAIKLYSGLNVYKEETSTYRFIPIIENALN